MDNESVCNGTTCSAKTYKVFVVLLALTETHNRFANRLLPCIDTLFKVSQEIRSSGVSSC